MPFHTRRTVSLVRKLMESVKLKSGTSLNYSRQVKIRSKRAEFTNNNFRWTSFRRAGNLRLATVNYKRRHPIFEHCMAKRKSNNNWKFFTGIMLAAIAVMGIMRLYEWYREQRSSFVRYDAFGIELPAEYEIHGIDVSKYQQIINWDLVRQMN